MKPSSDIALFTTTLPVGVSRIAHLFLRRTLECFCDPFGRSVSGHYLAISVDHDAHSMKGRSATRADLRLSKTTSQVRTG